MPETKHAVAALAPVQRLLIYGQLPNYGHCVRDSSPLQVTYRTAPAAPMTDRYLFVCIIEIFSAYVGSVDAVTLQLVLQSLPGYVEVSGCGRDVSLACFECSPYQALLDLFKGGYQRRLGLFLYCRR